MHLGVTNNTSESKQGTKKKKKFDGGTYVY